MTDEQIIKALESIESESIGDCKRDCAFYDGKVHFCGGVVAKHSLDIINRQKAEIERLNHIRAELSREIDRLEEAYSIYEETTGLKQVRNDSIKKFADRLKAEVLLAGFYSVEDIDNLVKETTEDKS
jgi:hypothetical protein